MTTLRDAAQQALEILERLHGGCTDSDDGTVEAITVWCPDVIDALRAALAEPVQEPEPGEYHGWVLREVLFDNGEPVGHREPQQEPVTWRWGYRSITTGEMDWRGYVEIPSHPNLRSPAIIMEPLYTAPPQRKPLTEEEIYKMYNALWRAGNTEAVAFARAIERAHGIGEQR